MMSSPPVPVGQDRLALLPAFAPLWSIAHIALIGTCIVVATQSFLLFHTLAELFAVIIGIQMFTVAWHTRAFSRNRVLVFIGSGFIWVALVDLAHALVFKGMHVLPVEEANPATQFWLLARYLQTIVILAAPLALTRDIPLRRSFALFGVLACGGALSIYTGVFFDAYVEGSGLTPFKIYSEYAIILLLGVAMFRIWQLRRKVEPALVMPLLAATSLTILSEFAFTLYLQVHAIENIIGHMLKISAFFILYSGIVENGFHLPLVRFREEYAKREVAEAHASDQSRRLSEILWSTKIGTWEWDIRTGRVLVNERWAETLDYRLAELEPTTARSLTAMWHPDDRARSKRLVEQLFSGKVDYYECEVRVRHKDGRWIWLLGRGNVVEWTEDGTPVRMSGTHADVTRRIDRENELKRQKAELELAGSVFQGAREGILVSDANGNIVAGNRAVTDITGYPIEEILGQSAFMFNSGRQNDEFYAEMQQTLKVRGHWEGELWNRRKNGSVYAEQLKIVAIRDEEGLIKNFVALFSDISRQKELQNELEQMAYYDSLTGLPNRVLLADRLRQAILEAKRDTGLCACLYIDLDGFKSVNDIYGHETGDKLLIALSQRMRRVLREGDTLSRVGGDEFVAVVSDLNSIVAAEALLERLLAAASEPVEIEGITAKVSASIGVAFVPQQGDIEPDLLLRQADHALYQSKQKGKHCFTVFDAEGDRNIRERHEALTQIRRALDNGEFRLFYQPKADLSAGKIIGAEALIRWQHPDRGILGPGLFLPVVDGHPLAMEIGDWVIRTALRQMGEWRRQGIDMPVSVNIDLRHLSRPDFPELLKGILEEHPDVPPGFLCLEILETSGMEDEAALIEIIRRCVRLGVTFAIDDFGTGYSSLSYLRQLPVDQIKIDQSFVRDMLNSTGDLAIVDGVIALADVFGKQVLAEGVESSELQKILQRLGCTHIQGYYLSRPIPSDEFVGWLAQWTPTPEAAETGKIPKPLSNLIYAQAEHRAWLKTIERHVSGDGAHLPEQETSNFRFTHWLEERGTDKLGSIARSVIEAHEQVQQIGDRIIGSANASASQELADELATLRAVSQEIIEKIDRLLDTLDLAREDQMN